MHLDSLKKLVAQGESENLEFKKSTGQRIEAVKTVCAMLNSAGGLVLFGVSDKGELVGQQASAKTIEDIAQEFKKLEPPAFPEIESIALGNGHVVIIVRVVGKFGTYCYDGRPFIRHGPTTQIMPRFEYEKRLIEKFHAHRRWENEWAPDWVTEKDLDENEINLTLENAVKLGRMKAPLHDDSLSILRGLGLFDEGRFINAAVVLYGKSERLFSNFPQLSIRLARFRGQDRLKGFMDSRDYWGNAFELLRKAENFLFDHVPISGRLVPGNMVREDFPLYPPLATREAIANAICHRDYTTSGGAVALAMYDKQLEIINPGELHFGISPEKLVKPHESKPWNPIIANVFYRAGIIEKWGTGTLSILDWCKRNGNPPPKWEERAQSIVTTFFPSSFFTEGKLPGEANNFSSRFQRPESEEPKARVRGAKGPSQRSQKPESEEPKARVRGAKGPSQEKIKTQLEEDILQLLDQGPLSKKDISKALGHKQISGALKKTLSDLMKRGKVGYTLPGKPNSRLQKYQRLN